MAVCASMNTKEYPMSCYFRNIAITAIIAIVVLSGCASTSMNPVGGDRSIKEPRVNSVAFWNIQLIDLTGTMATDSRYCTPGMRLRERGVDNYGSVIRAEPVAGTGDKPVWKKEDGEISYSNSPQRSTMRPSPLMVNSSIMAVAHLRNCTARSELTL